jgi:hypothetical protein
MTAKNIRTMMLEAAIAHAQSHVDKHKVNVEVYLTHPVGVGDHSNIMDSIEKELDEIARYEDHLEVLRKHFL